MRCLAFIQLLIGLQHCLPFHQALRGREEYSIKQVLKNVKRLTRNRRKKADGTLRKNRNLYEPSTFPNNRTQSRQSRRSHLEVVFVEYFGGLGVEIELLRG